MTAVSNDCHQAPGCGESWRKDKSSPCLLEVLGRPVAARVILETLALRSSDLPGFTPELPDLEWLGGSYKGLSADWLGSNPGSASCHLSDHGHIHLPVNLSSPS